MARSTYCAEKYITWFTSYQPDALALGDLLEHYNLLWQLFYLQSCKYATAIPAHQLSAAAVLSKQEYGRVGPRAAACSRLDRLLDVSLHLLQATSLKGWLQSITHDSWRSNNGRSIVGCKSLHAALNVPLHHASHGKLQLQSSIGSGRCRVE